MPGICVLPRSCELLLLLGQLDRGRARERLGHAAGMLGGSEAEALEIFGVEQLDGWIGRHTVRSPMRTPAPSASNAGDAEVVRSIRGEGRTC